MDKYDYLVIGSGPAGHVSAIRAAQLGLKVAVVEKDKNMFGGVCLNEGCIPAKSLYRSAEIFDNMKRSPELCGVDVEFKCVNMAEMVKKSREAAEQLCQGLLFLFKKNNIDLINGEARFIDKETVEIKGEDPGTFEVKADKFLIATGSVPRPLAGLPFDGEKVLDSSSAIRLEKVPKTILIVGGGAIGIEFASFFNLLGSEVTIIELEKTLLPFEDNEISKGIQVIFKQRKINVLTLSSVSDVLLEDFEVCIAAVGRTPATGDIGLEKAGVETDEKGYINVDSRMRTNVENIYAAGDCIATPMLAHVASAEGEVAAEAAAGGDPAAIDYDSVPNAVYSAVQVASVGITEEEAKEKNMDYAVGKQFFKANGKAVINKQTEGFIKVIADAETHELFGVHIIGHHATELIHEFVLAKRAGLTVEDIEKTVHAHPTFSETAVDACKAVFGKPIHG
ncbi:MAG: dihydrolipoyl dehydrogenase [Candidatus Omnitrophota bacterium]